MRITSYYSSLKADLIIGQWKCPGYDTIIIQSIIRTRKIQSIGETLEAHRITIIGPSRLSKKRHIQGLILGIGSSCSHSGSRWSSRSSLKSKNYPNAKHNTETE